MVVMPFLQKGNADKSPGRYRTKKLSAALPEMQTGPSVTLRRRLLYEGT